MASSRATLERIGARVPVPQPAYERLMRHRDRKRRNQRIVSAVVALILAAAAIGSAIRVLGVDVVARRRLVGDRRLLQQLRRHVPRRRRRLRSHAPPERAGRLRSLLAAVGRGLTFAAGSSGRRCGTRMTIEAAARRKKARG